jgi:hypothetical protein
MNKGLLVSLLVFQLALSQTATQILTEDIKLRACYRGGCNGEICAPFQLPYSEIYSPEDVKLGTDDTRISICWYRPFHRCLEYARCERQINGGCDFTVTVAYTDCLLSPFAYVDPPIYEVPLDSKV